MRERSYCWLIAPGMRNGAVHDVVHGPHRDPVIEDVAKQFDHAAGRTMADQHQGQDQLPQPSLGDRQVEKDVVGSWTRGCEGLVESLLGGVSLLIEELAADFMFPGQVRDWLSTSEHLDSQISPFLGQQPLGRPLREAGQFCGRPPRSDCVNEHENVAWASMPVSFVMVWD